MASSILQEGAQAAPSSDTIPAGQAGSKRLLVHMCCGPCACICLKTFREEGWDMVGFYHNPNIQPLAEYLRRREAAIQCAE